MTFFNNTSLTPYNGIVQIDRRINLKIEDLCTFEGNKGSPVQAITTNVTLSGTIIFKNNIAFQGGAISLKHSLLKLQSVNKGKVRIIFENNTATDVGGGIYIDKQMNIDSKTGSSCFIGTLDGDLGSTKPIFRTNKAAGGGTDIYGGALISYCLIYVNNTNSILPLPYESYTLKQIIYKTSSNLSAISSDPKRVCLCDSSSQPVCANISHIFYNTTQYPGEVFSLPLTVVGLEFGTVTGPVHASLLPQSNNSMSSLGKSHYVRQVTNHNSCTEFEFTVQSNSHNSKETIVLTVNNTIITKPDKPSSILDAIDSYFNQNIVLFPLLIVPVYIQVTLLDCPPGFVRTDIGKCDCITALKDIGINNCSIYNNTLHAAHSENQWIQLTSNSGSILTSKYCPFNYCKQN